MIQLTQVTRIARDLPESLRPGALKVAAAVDKLPFQQEWPSLAGLRADGALSRSLGRNGVPGVRREDVQLAHTFAKAGVEELAGKPQMYRANSHATSGVAQLEQVLDATPMSQEFVDPGMTGLVNAASRDLDRVVRSMNDVVNGN